MQMTGFRITGSRGFHITFENGVTVSVQFGGGNYGDNYDEPIGEEPKRKILESATAEVAVWDKANNWILLEYSGDAGGGILGWQTPAQVLAILNWAAQREATR
jgi:hypothetical protein